MNHDITKQGGHTIVSSDELSLWFEQLCNAARANTQTASSCKSALDRALDRLVGRDVLVYGSGSFGREIYNLLLRHGIRATAFLDRKASEGDLLYGVPIYRADDPSLNAGLKQNATVLFSIVMDKEERRKAIEFLASCGFYDIVESQAIRCLQVRPDDLDAPDINEQYLLLQRDRMLNAAQLLKDDESLATYMSVIMAHAGRIYENCPERPMREQYFPSDIRLVKGGKRFIDCGAYIGDTIELVLHHHGDIERAVLLEPVSANFDRLNRTADRLCGRVREISLYPCAVAEKTGIGFFSGEGGSGALHTDGISVMTVALDDILKGFRPTFIKMDIEGAELSALRGARRTILESRPDIAICTYHHTNHIWDIPLLLDSWGLGYSYYLRTYNACTMETVLYATQNPAYEELP